MVRSWLAKRPVTWNMEALNRGDVRPTLRMEARDVHFRFPGTSSWAIDELRCLPGRGGQRERFGVGRPRVGPGAGSSIRGVLTAPTAEVMGFSPSL